VALIVQKYGGTSVADPDRIKSVADHIAFTRKHGNDVVVVVSAMGKSTDNLLSLANAVSDVHPGREMDIEFHRVRHPQICALLNQTELALVCAGSALWRQ
jgi:aspartokinase